MSAVWPEFAFPFPPDAKLLRKQHRTAKQLWSEQCAKDLELFLTINHTNEFTSEDFKVWCIETLHRAVPVDGRSWSAVWCGAVRSGKVEKVRKTKAACSARTDCKKIVMNVYKRKYR